MINPKEYLDSLSKAHNAISLQMTKVLDEELQKLSETEQAIVKKDLIDKSLHFDPLVRAEEIAGISYKDKTLGKSITSLGMGLMWANKTVKDTLLKEANDVYLSCPLPYYINVIESNNFEKCLALPFECQFGKENTLYVYWHSDGLLLSFYVYGNSNKVSCGSVYYNWVKDVEKINYNILSSHSAFEKDENGKEWIAGQHDCREGLMFNLNRLRENGHFLNPWRKQSLWLLHSGDTMKEGYDHKTINAERIAMLPKHVQEAIKG